MRTKFLYWTLIVSMFMVCFASNLVFGAIPASERAALIALYNSTNGDRWTQNTGWKTPPLAPDGFAMPGTEGNWYGIDTSNGDEDLRISLPSNYLQGHIPKELENLSNLTQLILDNNKLNGSIPPELGNLSNLSVLLLSNNQLSGSIPSELGKLNNLCSFYLFNNQLSGSIPPELGNLTKLTYLSLYGNQLSGSIPPELGNMSSLQTLYLYNNQLSGSIPPELGNIGNLKDIYLSNNQLSGSIPPEFGNLSYLTLLHLEYNQLSGSIPPEIGNMFRLTNLNLSNNQLSGEIPSSLALLDRITTLDIRYNCLFAVDPVLRAYLNTKNPSWESYQNQCGGLTVKAPNGGEIWAVGSYHDITWTTNGSVGNVKIEYSTNNGNTWNTVIASTENDGVYNWKLPNLVSTQYLIKVSEASDGNPTDMSNSTFSVVADPNATLTLQIPNGGESWTVGSKQTITWSSQGTVGEVKLEYSANGGTTWSTIVNYTQNNGMFDWTVPNPPSSQCKIRISESIDGVPMDTSDSDFTIAAVPVPTIKVDSPNGGQNWIAGSFQPITWSSSGGVGDVKIEYSTDNGSSWSIVTASTPNSGSFTWEIPSTPSPLCKVRVSDAANSSVADTSDSTFTIMVTPSTITVISPNGGETWNTGSTQVITWSTTGTIGNVKIDVSINNGVTWTNLVSSTENDGRYDWIIPYTASSQCFVKITEVANSNYTDTSDAAFTIHGTIPAQEREALIALYNSTAGDNWTNKNGWKTPPLYTDGFSMPGTEGNWYGIVIQDYHVTRLNLYTNNLTGNIPSQIENLNQLEVIMLTSNKLNGSIPQSLGNLCNLESLWLGFNKLSGSIPSNFGNLHNLNTLFLRSNQLTGQIPTELMNLARLSVLDIGYNCLTNTNYMMDIWLSALDSDWELNQNQCSSVTSTIHVKTPNGGESYTVGAIQSITWSTSGVVGDVKIEYTLNNGSTWTTITAATPNDGIFMWNIPTAVSAQCKIRISEAADETLSDTSDGLFSIVSLEATNITVLTPNGGETLVAGSPYAIKWSTVGSIGYIKIECSTNNGNSWYTVESSASNTGTYSWTVPDTNSNSCFIKLTDTSNALKTDISDKSFIICKGVKAEERAALIALYNATNGDSWTKNTGWKNPPLYTDGFAMPGTESSWYGIGIGAHDTVSQIILKGNNLTGTLPELIGNFSGLNTLYLDRNAISGIIPETIGNLSNLQDLRLGNNNLSGTIPATIGNLQYLTSLELSNNQLTGDIPVILGSLTQLKSLILARNMLTGSISVLNNLTQLTYVDFSYNRFSGSIPAELANLTNLKELYLQGNRLDGSIPTEIGNLTSLIVLYLHENRLSGSIPAQLGRLFNLQYLYLRANRLEGEIPVALSQLQRLTMYTDFSYNALYTADTTLLGYLSGKDSDWQDTQTIAPRNVRVVGVTGSSVTLNWDVISYKYGNGGYEILYSQVSGGPYTSFGLTENKTITSVTVTGLNPAVAYYFVIRTRTNAHWNNANIVVSGNSEEVSAITAPF